MKRNIERFPSKQMYPYLSLVERKVAEFYHNIDRRSWLVWVKMTYFHCFFRTIPGVLGLLEQSLWQLLSLWGHQWGDSQVSGRCWEVADGDVSQVWDPLLLGSRPCRPPCWSPLQPHETLQGTSHSFDRPSASTGASERKGGNKQGQKQKLRGSFLDCGSLTGVELWSL